MPAKGDKTPALRSTPNIAADTELVGNFDRLRRHSARAFTLLEQELEVIARESHRQQLHNLDVHRRLTQVEYENRQLRQACRNLLALVHEHTKEPDHDGLSIVERRRHEQQLIEANT